MLELFLSHALRDGYFHADMHQGNLKVAANGDIIAYDFGIMGHIDEYTRRVYAEILYGFIQRDYIAVWPKCISRPDTCRRTGMWMSLRGRCGPWVSRSLAWTRRNISMGQPAELSLFEVTERFGMETRTELILLQRTMVVVEGVARSLDPHINIWQVARPIVEDYIKQSIGPRALLRDLGRTLQVVARFGPQLPQLAEAALVRQAQDPMPKPTSSPWRNVGFMALGAALVGVGAAIASLF